MTDSQFRAFLNLYMCMDPWPDALSGADRYLLESYAEEESKRRGFDSWVDAYHNFWPGKTPDEGGELTRRNDERRNPATEAEEESNVQRDP